MLVLGGVIDQVGTDKCEIYPHGATLAYLNLLLLGVQATNEFSKWHFCIEMPFVCLYKTIELAICTHFFLFYRNDNLFIFISVTTADGAPWTGVELFMEQLFVTVILFIFNMHRMKQNK